MSERLDLEAARQLHRVETRGSGITLQTYCGYCSADWPCDTVRLLDAVEELRGLLDRAGEYVVVANWSSDRDALLADIDRVLAGLGHGEETPQ